MLFYLLLQEEEALISAHRREIENTMEIVREVWFMFQLSANATDDRFFFNMSVSKRVIFLCYHEFIFILLKLV